MTNYPDSEQALENATIELFRSLGYEATDAYHETFGAVAHLDVSRVRM